MRIRSDLDGLESLPLRLMIVAVVATMSVVPAATMLETLQAKEFMNRAALQLEKIVSAVQVLAIEGPGGVRTLSLEFGSQGELRFRGLVMGDDQGGPNMSSVQLLLSNGARMVRTSSEPPVWLRDASGHGLTVSAPACDLRLSAVLEDGLLSIVAEAS
ncbi:MAG: hypothetical protein A3K67_06315 [Euryarchaeota archaeon RBG_16_62_10]|nr:MAG: hypothetical protein A3K67_06315 [Euryarchaeota archaeon RBG_16_62_10]